ncbi:MAG TPA: plastocyanin/azurin family copper-binding protein [Gaiellaceae bacterium]|nr:plastocyanin/azurin family copper-binding protein [Gaiellaceae bacterium]
MLLLAGMATGNKIGLAVVAAVFIAFALSASFLAPRRWPEFPGRHALSVFVIACFVLFAGMVSAVLVFGKETEEAHGAAPAQTAPATAAARTIKVTESEFKIALPPQKSLTGGTYTFQVHNAGKIPHDLVISGGHATGQTKTPTIPAGGDATLKVTLGAGQYTLYCSLPGHRQLGMQAQLAVG